jgi:hypothetical protein
MKQLFYILFAVLILNPILKGDEHAYLTAGLVLSGGGAKGISHVGVIKALEEYRIPFQCISGVSAGNEMIWKSLIICLITVWIFHSYMILLSVRFPMDLCFIKMIISV